MLFRSSSPTWTSARATRPRPAQRSSRASWGSWPSTSSPSSPSPLDAGQKAEHPGHKGNGCAVPLFSLKILLKILWILRPMGRAPQKHGRRSATRRFRKVVGGYSLRGKVWSFHPFKEVSEGTEDKKVCVGRRVSTLLRKFRKTTPKGLLAFLPLFRRLSPASTPSRPPLGDGEAPQDQHRPQEGQGHHRQIGRAHV